MFLHEIYPAVFTSGGASVTINQLDQVDPQPGIEVLEATMAGSLDPAVIATTYAEPKVNFGCRDVQTVLTGVGLMTGFAVNTLAKIQYQLRQNKGGYATGSSHLNLTSTGGFLYVADFSAKQDDKEGAMINTVYCPVWDGSTYPLVVNDAQALVGSPAANSVHALGPVDFEAISGGLAGVQSVAVKTGIEVKFTREGGALFAAVVTISKRKPMIEVELYNQKLASLLTLGQTYPITAGCSVYLQRVIPGGGRYGYGTSNHIKATITEGTYKVDSMSGSKGDFPRLKISIMPTNNNISLAPATTISLTA
jgi:hypothetical protein